MEKQLLPLPILTSELLILYRRVHDLVIEDLAKCIRDNQTALQKAETDGEMTQGLARMVENMNADLQLRMNNYCADFAQYTLEAERVESSRLVVRRFIVASAEANKNHPDFQFLFAAT